MEKIQFNINQSVFKVGELPDKMYLLVKGSVGIFLPTNETNKPNFIIQENELFGEMGVIENELRMASARCLKESIIISVTKEEFEERVNNSDVFVKVESFNPGNSVKDRMAVKMIEDAEKEGKIPNLLLGPKFEDPSRRIIDVPPAMRVELPP